jgi:hypothetical protein
VYVFWGLSDGVVLDFMLLCPNMAATRFSRILFHAFEGNTKKARLTQINGRRTCRAEQHAAAPILD